jgi:hypothetical protein
LKTHLEVTIPDHNSYYTLYSDGVPSWKTYDRQKKITLLYYPPNSVLALYYTYPNLRKACVIRYLPDADGIILPGINKNVSLLFEVSSSRVDKLKRAVNWFNTHSAGAFVHDDGFYTRLGFLLERRGKINYPALSILAEKSSANKQIPLALF